jgi:hypothetical protein
MHTSQGDQSFADEPPVVGDYLKIMFVENKVVPTILVSRVGLQMNKN